jgi:predicted PurR-regulated permease PerM
MDIPPPTPKQARILWMSLTAFAVAVLAAIVVSLCICAGWVLKQLSSVLLPIAVSAICAYLLDPVVDYLERRKIPRSRAILLVFLLMVAVGVGGLATVVPQLVVETGSLVNQLPEYSQRLQSGVSGWMAKSPIGAKAREMWESQYGAAVQAWLSNALPDVSSWVLTQLTRAASWAGLLTGLAMAPVYIFYFLLEKTGINRHWTDYLPVRESAAKGEIVFVLESINNYLIVFFRGQVLVALCDGVLLTIGFVSMGLEYALLLGLMAGMLSIVPFLGVALSLIPATILALVQFGDWLHPLLVLGVFAAVQAIEGFFISPKIIGDRVGLHPLAIIIAVMVGTTLLGGILGGILAIPLTAALRVLMFRYVWRQKRD